MAITVAGLLAASVLRLRLLTGDPETPVSWVHSSDLADPTPFLEPGNLLLTTGPRLAGRGTGDDFDGYVRRLAGHGVRALGFGTEVVRAGTPAELVSACAGRGVALVEVPYHTPFIAVSRWVANALAEQAHARDRWTLRAQRALAVAALSRTRIAAVLAELARQLPAVVVLLDSTGAVLSRHTRRGFRGDHLAPGTAGAAAMRREATRLLRRELRSSAALVVDGRTVHLQTLGREGELRGVLAVSPDDSLDAAARSVVTSAVALAEFALEDANAERARRRAWHHQLFELLLGGQVTAVDRTLAAVAVRLPAPPLRLALITLDHPPEELERALTERAAGQRTPLFTAPAAAVDGGGLAVVLEAGWQTTLIEIARAHGARIGVSGPTGYDRLEPARGQARAALRRAEHSADAVAVGADLVLGLLPRDQVAELARSRLAVLRGDAGGRELLAVAEVWLRHNAQWDPAARELGRHRHTVKAQIRQLERCLDLALDTFDAKAQLWALLISS